MHIDLHSGLLTQLLYGAYNYEGGNCKYVVTAGQRSMTEPEFDASMLEQETPTEEPTQTPAGETEQKAGPGIWIAGGAAAVLIGAAAVIIAAASRKKKIASGK